jgi:hypothetical protein
MPEIGMMQVKIDLPHKATFVVVFTSDDHDFEVADGRLDLTTGLRDDMPEDFKDDLKNWMIVEMDKARCSIQREVTRAPQNRELLRSLGVL